jgi:hypothetical protein
MNSKRFAVVLTWGLLGLIIALLWLLTGQPAVAQPTEWTVCPVGPPTCDFDVIQDAVDAASDGDTIKVATGTYTDVHNHPAPPGYPNSPASGLNQIVYIDKSITIRGGYTALDFSIPPDFDANPTTLNAQEQGRGILIAGNANPTVEGFRVTGGDSTGLAGGHSWDGGGGVYVI